MASCMLCTQDLWCTGLLWGRVFVARALGFSAGNKIEELSSPSFSLCDSTFLVSLSEPLPPPSLRSQECLNLFLFLSFLFPGTITWNTFELKGVYLKKKMLFLSSGVSASQYSSSSYVHLDLLRPK